MNKLNDEILNKYIDGDLDHTSSIQIKGVLSTSIEDKKRYLALLTVHNELKNIKEEHVKDGFTNQVMNKLLSKKKAFREQRNFVIAISSIFISLIVFIIGLVIYYSFTSAGEPQTTKNYIQVVLPFFQSIVSGIAQLFTAKGISVFGSILSLGILISGYFFFENIKSSRFKNNGVS